MYDLRRNRNESQSFKYSCDGKSFQVYAVRCAVNVRGWMPPYPNQMSQMVSYTNARDESIDAKRNFDIFDAGIWYKWAVANRMRPYKF